MNTFPFIEETALAAVLYIVRQFSGSVSMHRLAKILYFADQRHLVKYGRTIIGDQYSPMQFGPVPISIYEALKTTHPFSPYKLFVEQIKVNGRDVESQCAPDMDELSESDVECLDWSIAEHRHLSFGELTEKSHGMAWDNANNEYYPYLLIEDIAKEGGASEEFVEYIKDNISDHYLFL